MMDGKDRTDLQNFEQDALIHLDALLKTASRIVHPLLDPRDIVQETYMRAWKHFNSYEAGTNCRAWLYRIMFNVIKARGGAASKRAETQIEDENFIESRSRNIVPFDPLRKFEEREVLKIAARLPIEQREVMWLIIVEEYTYREAAEILDLPIGTVMSRLHRARRELRKLLLSEDRHMNAS